MMSFSLGNSGLMTTTLAEQTPQRRYGLTFSIMNGAAPVGAFMGPLIGGPLVNRYGFRTLLALNAILTLATALELASGYKDHYQGKGGERLLTMALDSVRIIYSSPRSRPLFPALFLLDAGWMLAYTYLPLATTRLYQGPDQGTAVGLIMGVGGLSALVFSPLIGALADRYVHWRVLLAGALEQVILWPIPSLAHELVSFGLAWAIINGLASGIFAISFSVLASSSPTHVRGRIMSFSYLPVNMGVVIGPAIGSLVTRSIVFAVFPTASALTALSIGMLLIAHRNAALPD